MIGRTFRIDWVPYELGEQEIQECAYLDPAQSKKFSKGYILEEN
jgi:hypothetical protein